MEYLTLELTTFLSIQSTECRELVRKKKDKIIIFKTVFIAKWKIKLHF